MAGQSKHLVPVSSCRAAEATKLLENIFRSVNIALVNELKLVYSAMNIDVWEVINAAKTKPFGFMPFYPGPGLGGHCIPIDPFYLTWKAREFGQNTRFIELAGEINTAMPMHVVNRTAEALNAHRKAVNGSRVLIVGLAYKPNVDDERESPSYVLMNILRNAVPRLPITILMCRSSVQRASMPIGRASVRCTGTGQRWRVLTPPSSRPIIRRSTTRNWPTGRRASWIPATPWPR